MGHLGRNSLTRPLGRGLEPAEIEAKHYAANTPDSLFEKVNAGNIQRRVRLHLRRMDKMNLEESNVEALEAG